MCKSLHFSTSLLIILGVSRLLNFCPFDWCDLVSYCWPLCVCVSTIMSEVGHLLIFHRKFHFLLCVLVVHILCPGSAGCLPLSCWRSLCNLSINPLQFFTLRRFSLICSFKFLFIGNVFLYSGLGTVIDKTVKQKGESNLSVFSFMVGVSSLLSLCLSHVQEIFA